MKFYRFFVSLIFIAIVGWQSDTAMASNRGASMMSAPTLIGENSVCSGTQEYIYQTDPGMTNYIWSISSGGTITSGGTLTSSTVTVTWSTPGNQSISIIYDGATSTSTMNILVVESLPVSITISTANDTVCEGSNTLFTATQANGGTNPVYQWKVNTVNLGSNSPTLIYTPSNGDVVTCLITSSLECTVINPVLSNSIVMTVLEDLAVNVTISASNNPVCLGQSVTFSATPYNGGTSPTFQWQLNGINVGSGGTTFTYVPTNGDVVKCILTSNLFCTTGNPATSNVVTMTVSPIQPVSVSIVASSNPACIGSTITYTATPTNGGTTPIFNWTVNGFNTGASSATFTYTPTDGDEVQCHLTSSIGCPLGNPAASNVIEMEVQPYYLVGNTISASANPVCQGTNVTFTASPVNGGASPSFQWLVNGFTVGGNSSTYIYPPDNGDVVTCFLTSDLLCTNGNPATSNTISMVVSPNLVPSITISTATNPSCQGLPVSFSATPTNGGSNPTYTWKVNGIISGTNSSTFTYTPVNGDLVHCELISNNPCASATPVASNAIQMSVSSNLSVGISIVASQNPVCTGVSVTFTATGTNGGATPTYSWKLNGEPVGGNQNSYTYIPSNGDIITCLFTSSITCASGNPATSNAISMTVSSNLPCSISISTSANPSCINDSVEFSAIGINGGISPTYQWLVNGVNAGTNKSTYKYLPINGDKIKCYLTSSNSCATGSPAISNEIEEVVNNYLPLSVSILASANPVCQGSLVTFTANAINAGSTPIYQWRVNGNFVGTNQSTYAFFPQNGNVVTCIVTSSWPCAQNSPDTSNSITLTVYPVVPAGITISASNNPVCTGTQVTFSATAVNGGLTPSFQWTIGGSNFGNNSSTFIYTPNQGDVIRCKLTSSLMCVSGNPITSDPITMTVASSLPVSLTISPSANPFCQGSNVTFYSYASNSGNAPVYQWKVNGVVVGLNQSIFSYTPQANDFVSCAVTSNLSCATNNPAASNPILMLANSNTPASVSILASENPVCQGSSVTFTATPTNGGSAPIYQWWVNGIQKIGSGSTYTYIPIQGDIVSCKLISNAACVYGSPATSNTITMSVSNALPASVTILASDNPFCSGNTITFNASPMVGGTSPTYQWKVNGSNIGSGGTFYSYVPLDGDIVSCDMTSNASCITGSNPVGSNQIIMSQAVNLPVSVSIAESANPVCQGTQVTYVATATNPGHAPTYQWKVNNLPVGTNSAVYRYTPVNGDVVKCVVTSSLTCATGNPATSNSVTMTVNTPSPVAVTITASSNPVCIGTTETFTAVVTNGGTAPTYLWRINGLPVGDNLPTYSYIPLNGDLVTCQVTSNGYCVSNNPAISNQINITVRTELPVSVSIAASENPFCIGNQVTITATPTNGGTAPWFEWKVNGVVVGGTGTSYSYIPADGDSIVCKLTSNQACICNNPATSNTIYMRDTTGLPVSVTIIASMNPICAGTEIFFTATPVNGGSAPYYQWKVNGVNKGAHAPTFSWTPNNGDIITVVVTSNLNCATNNPATSNGIMMTVYPQNPVSITVSPSINPCCAGTSVTFTANTVNAGTSPFYRWRVNGLLQGTNSPTFTYTPVNNDVVYCNLTSNALCPVPNYPINSNSITMSVVPFSAASVSIAPNANPVCQGTSVLFTATPTNAGSTPYFQWKVNGAIIGSNSSTFLYTPLNGDVVKCDMTSSGICTSGVVVTSNSVTMAVSPILTVDISINTMTNPVCAGNSVSFTATYTNGGGSPSFNWLVNGTTSGVHTSSFSYIPSNGDQVSCILTSNAACTVQNVDTSNVIVMSVTNNLPVSVSVSPSSTPPCQGQAITFTATGDNGGTNPTYDWMVNGIVVGNNTPTYSYTPVSGDVIKCIYTSNYSCPTGNPAISDPVTMSFSPYEAASISITSSANPSCLGSPVTLSSSVVNGGATPAFQWKVNNINVGLGLPTYNYTPANGDIITCVLTSSVPCPISNPVASNPILMNVLQPVAASISIQASQNPACVGSSITFSATTLNAGSTPTYLWKVNGSPMGASQSTFCYIPANNDVVTCQLTSSVTCISNNPVISNSISMVVTSDLPASVSIVASDDEVCNGFPVTFTATPINGGLTPVYHWLVNGINVGSDTNVYTYVPTNNDLVKCQMISSFTCASNNPALSIPITMEVQPNLPVSVSITSSFNPACTGVPITFTANPTNGGSNPSYQWKVNGLSVGSNLSTHTYAPVNGDIVQCQVSSSLECKSGDPAMSNAINMIIGTSFPVSVTVSPSANPVCELTVVTFTATGTNGGTLPFYQWKVNGVAVGGNSTTYTYTPSNNDIVTCTLTSNYSCGSGNPATSNAVTMVVIPTPIGITIDYSPLTPVCAGSNVTLTAYPTNGGPNPGYQWKVNGINAGPNNPVYTYPPNNGDVVLCVLTSSATCATGNTVASLPATMSVIPLTVVDNTITASPSGSVCTGTDVTFVAFPTNGGTNPMYEWKVNGTTAGSNQSTFTFTPQNGDEVHCLLTSNAICPSVTPHLSNSIQETVLPLMPVTVFIDANPAGAVCAGTMVTYTATGFNGGSSPTYLWKVNGIDQLVNNPIFTYQPNHGDIITCAYNSNIVCPTGNPALSNPISMVVHPILPVSISVDAQPSGAICDGTMVTFTAQPTNEGSSPIYTWKVNGNTVGSNLPTYSYIPVNNDIVTCTLTSDALCTTGNPATSSPLHMMIHPLHPVSLSITGVAGDSVCAGTNVTFQTNLTNGGTNPAYQWTVNGVNFGTSSTYTYIPIQGDVIQCQVTSNEVCPLNNPALSNSITMVVHQNNPVSLTVSSSPTGSVCAGTSVNFLASPTNGGTTPQYSWTVNGSNAGTNDPNFSYSPINGDLVACSLNSNVGCPQGNPASCNSILMTVNPLQPVSIGIAVSPSTSVCQGESVTFTSTITNGGSTPAFLWKVNGSSTGSNSSTFTYTPANGDVVVCVLTSSDECAIGNPAISNSITMTVNPLNPVSVAISSTPSGAICAGTSVTYSSTTVNGGSVPMYQWFVNGFDAGNSGSTLTYIPSDNDMIQCKITSNALCPTGNPAFSNSLIMDVNPILPVSISIVASPSDSVCSATPVTYNAIAINGGVSPQFEWKVNGVIAGSNSSSFTYTPIHGDVIQCSLTSSELCQSGNPAQSNTVSMRVYPMLPVTIITSPTPSGDVCAGTSVTYTAVGFNAGTAPTYQWKINGMNVGGNTTTYSYSPLNGDVVECQLISNAICPTGNPASSLPINMIVHPVVPIDISIVASGNALCEGTTISYTATATNPGTFPTYQWKVNGTLVGGNLATYSYIPTNGDIVTCFLIPDAYCPTSNPAISNSITMNMLHSPYVAFNLCTPITSRDGQPIILKGGIPAGGSFSGNGVIGGKFYPNLLPVGVTTSVIQYHYNSISGCADSASQTIQVSPTSSFTCGNSLLDIRDSQTYPTILVGGQCWFATNLNFGSFKSSAQSQRDNCLFDKYCSEDNPANCNTYGGLYQWDEVMQFEINSESQGICPPGWHIPSESDWLNLINSISDLGHAGDELKEGGSSGFNALMGGAIFNVQHASFTTSSTFFWTSSETSLYKAIAHSLHTSNHGIATYPSSKANAFYVRCMKD